MVEGAAIIIFLSVLLPTLRSGFKHIPAKSFGPFGLMLENLAGAKQTFEAQKKEDTP